MLSYIYEYILHGCSGMVSLFFFFDQSDFVENDSISGTIYNNIRGILLSTVYSNNCLGSEN